MTREYDECDFFVGDLVESVERKGTIPAGSRGVITDPFDGQCVGIKFDCYDDVVHWFPWRIRCVESTDDIEDVSGEELGVILGF